jgi:hypothetical protein
MTGKTQTFEWFSMLNHSMASAKDAVHLIDCFSTAGYQELNLQGQTVDH